MMRGKSFQSIGLLMALLALAVGPSVAQGPGPQERLAPQAPVGVAFTYQGQLKQSNSPVNSTCNFQFSLWDAPGSGSPPSGGNAVGSVQPANDITVTNGLFTVLLNAGGEFGGTPFTSDARYLQIAVKCGSETVFTTVSPRQALTPAPYALALPGMWTQQTGASPNIIGGYHGNSVTSGVVGATISGGGGPIPSAPPETNIVTDDYGTVGGGQGNQAGNNTGTVGDATSATVGGGRTNSATGAYATIGGGYGNVISPTATYATVSGGMGNFAGSDRSTIGGGFNNAASGSFATIAGGDNSLASGAWATIPGGRDNHAVGDYSFAAGRQARVNHIGAFVWADSTEADFASTGPNQFLVRASGGVWFGSNSSPSIPAGRFLNTSTGGYLTTGGVWTDNSDRNSKENFASLDGLDILNRLMRLPIQSWNYKAEDASVRHIGPTAQDFYAAFQVGNDDTHLAALDTNGVALAAIQGLYQRSQEQATRITKLEAENVALQQRLDSLETRLAALEVGAGRPARTGFLPGAEVLVVGLALGLLFWRGTVFNRPRGGGE